MTNDELAYEILDYLRRNKSFLSPYEKVDEEEYFPGGNMNALVMRDVQRFKDKQAVTFWIRKRGEERIIEMCIRDRYNTMIIEYLKKVYSDKNILKHFIQYSQIHQNVLAVIYYYIRTK